MNTASLARPLPEGARALALLAREVTLAPAQYRLDALRDSAIGLRLFVSEGLLNPADVRDKIFEVAGAHGLSGEPGSAAEIAIGDIVRLATDADGEGGLPPVFDEIDPDELERKTQWRAAELVQRWEAADPRDNPALRTGNEQPQDEPPQWFINSIMPDPEPDSAPGGHQHHAQPAAPLMLVCPPAWRDMPLEPMRWLATRRIPARDATILSGDGGGGKTTVALQLAVAVERGLGDWLGTVCESGPVIFFSGEEPENEMRRRLDRVVRKRGIEPAEIESLHFHFADPDSCLLGISRPNGPMVPIPLFEALRAAALEIRPVLIVVDSIAATFGGNQNDRVHARSFVGMFRRLAHDVDCAVLLLDHPSLSGITSGTGRGGSMDWQNATRARLHLETVDDQEGGTDRVLEVKKTNYGPNGEKVKLRWEDGCFVMQGTAPTPARAAAEHTADQVYLDCLDAATAQGRNVFPGTGKGYAPGVFADMPEAKSKGVRKPGLIAAQERLFAAGLIWNEPFGPPTKGSRRVARKTAGGAQ